MIGKAVREAVQEAYTYLLIALDLALGFVTWLLVAGLVPGDRVHFNVLGSVVMIVVCTYPWYRLDKFVQRRINA